MPVCLSDSEPPVAYPVPPLFPPPITISPPFVVIFMPFIKRTYPLTNESLSVRSSTLVANNTSPPWVDMVVTTEVDVSMICVLANILKALFVVLVTLALKVTFCASIVTSPLINFDCKVVFNSFAFKL